MPNTHANQHITDEERRDFLKALGVGGAVAAGTATLDDVREAVTGGTANELASIGRAIQADLVGEPDAELLAEQQTILANAASLLPTIGDKGFPENEPRVEFTRVADASRPVYEHLATVGFFESTTRHLPEFTPTSLTRSVETFVRSEALAVPLTDLGLTGEEGMDLVATVVANADELSTYHWVATDKIPRERIEFGESIPPMTQATAGGALLWLADLDNHLWQKQVVLTDEILTDTIWHARAMAAGLQLMTEGAKTIAEEPTALTDSELGALLSTGFAVQAIAQNLLAQDVYWIDETMRAPRRTDLETITDY